jgi:hypothetical protein
MNGTFFFGEILNDEENSYSYSSVDWSIADVVICLHHAIFSQYNLCCLSLGKNGKSPFHPLSRM